MLTPRKVTRKQVQADPDIVWREFLGLMGISSFPEMSDTQQTAFFVFWYDKEVRTDGHFWFLHNHAVAWVAATINALRRLRADGQANVLSQALCQDRATPSAATAAVDKNAEAAAQKEFAPLDQAFHQCRPPLAQVLKDFLDQQPSEFVVIEN